MSKYIKNHKGLTLVELLATLVVISLIAIIGTSILVTGINRYSDISAENSLRDEADIILAQFYRDIYPKRESEIDKVFVDGVLKKSSVPNDSTINTLVKDKKDSYVLFKNGDKYGFEGTNPIIKNEIHKFNPSIQLITQNDGSANYSQIIPTGDNGYIIKLVLKNSKKDLVRTFEHQLSTINDIEEGGN